MNTMTAANDKILSLYCAARASVVSTKAAIKDRESGQANVEYLGLLLILGAALALGGGLLSSLGIGGGEGPLVGFVQNAIKEGLRSALSKLGIEV